MPPKRQKEPLFRLGRYWIDKVAGSKRLYYFRYDPGSGEVRKRTLKTTDLEAAKIALAAIALTKGDGQAREPGDVTLVAVFNRYWAEHSDRRPNPSAARRAWNMLLDFLRSDAAKVAVLTRAKQIEFMRTLRERGLSVAYISRVMAIIAAAINRATADDDADDQALSSALKASAAGNRAASIGCRDPRRPGAGTAQLASRHSDVSQLPRRHPRTSFLDAIPEEEETRLLRFTILTLVFGRPEAVKELRPFQIDERHRLVHLNAPGRRQTKKRRATLPMPDILWPTLLSWRDAETIVHRDGNPVIVLRKPWGDVRRSLDLPAAFTPKSLRHMLATELWRRGVDREQREMWQGHRRERTNDQYGRFGPDFLDQAKEAVQGLLTEIDSTANRSLFRQVTAKSIGDRELPALANGG